MPTVLIVERDAHRRMGHFPSAFASVADGFAALGCTVHALTQQGWLHGDGPADGAFSVHRFDRSVAWLDRTVVRARMSAYGLALHRYPDSPKVSALAARVADLSDMCSSALAGVAVRRWSRARGEPDLVIVLTYYTTPAVFGLMVGSLPTLVYAFVGPRRRTRRVSRLLQRLPATTTRLCVATGDEATAARWARELPTVTVGTSRVVGIGVTRDTWSAAGRAESRRSARAHLGLGDDEHLALLFGAGHPEQDAAVVERAFASPELADVGLMVAGAIADRMDQPDRFRLVRRGFVPPEEIDDLLDAADVAVLSFREGFERDSATLIDAVRHGLPVVVSDGSAPADLVARHQLGVRFQPGDAASLIDAVHAAPRELPGDAVRRAQNDLSAVAVARRLADIAGVRLEPGA